MAGLLCTAVLYPAHQMFQHGLGDGSKKTLPPVVVFFLGFLAYIHQMIENVYAFIYVDTFPTQICEFRNIVFRPLYLENSRGQKQNCQIQTHCQVN